MAPGFVATAFSAPQASTWTSRPFDRYVRSASPFALSCMVSPVTVLVEITWDAPAAETKTAAAQTHSETLAHRETRMRRMSRKSASAPGG